MISIINSLIDTGIGGEYLDYSAAEQAVMAISSILQTLYDNNSLTKTEYLKLNQILDIAFQATEDDEKYMPLKFISAIKSLKSAMRPFNS